MMYAIENPAGEFSVSHEVSSLLDKSRRPLKRSVQENSVRCLVDWADELLISNTEPVEEF